MPIQLQRSWSDPDLELYRDTVVRFLEEDQAGFWEEGGYHMRGVPWGPGDGERFRWS